jgi:hypothetical protein
MRVERRRGRGQALAAAGTVVAVGAALALLDAAGPRTPRQAAGARAPSGAWVCPHGGGDGWTASVFLANPGRAPVAARVTSLGDRAPDAPTPVDVPPGRTVAVPADAREPGGSTYVEFFGGWIGAGWTASAGRAGGSAEPCAADSGRRWLVVDGSTQQADDAFLVVANPFATSAVIDVGVHSPDRAPVRPSDWTDLVVRPGRSIALRLDSQIEGEPVAAADVEASVGRVVAGSVVVTDGSRIRSALGATAPRAGSILPVVGGSGQAELLVLSIADRSIRIAATELSDEPPRPAGGLTEREQGPLAAAPYAVPVDGGPSAIRLFVLGGDAAASALRALGPGGDLGSTSGTSMPASAWIVFPALASPSAERSIVLVNDGDASAVATLELLPGETGAATAPVTVDVPAHGAAAVPPAFLASAAGSAVLLRSAGGPVTALSASASPGDGDGSYALSLGVPVPRPS